MRRRVLRAAIGAAACCLSLAPLGWAAFPSAGIVREGVGAGGVTIGMPIAQARRAWGLGCFRLPPGDAVGQCQALSKVGGQSYVQQVGFDQLGRVTSITVRDPRWRTSRGVSPGDPIAKLRGAYGGRLRSRITSVWSYFELDARVGGRVRRTSILGRTKVGDVVEVTVAEAPVPRLTLTRPATGGLIIGLTGWYPLADVPLSLTLGASVRDVQLGKGRTDRHGAMTFREPAFGVLDRLLANRRLPVTATIDVFRLTDSLVTPGRRLRAKVSITSLPAEPVPALSVTPSRATGADANVSVKLTGGVQGGYELFARWSCPGAAPTDTRVELLLGPSSTTTVSLDFLRGDRFGIGCVGDPAPAELPVTLVLRREGKTSDLTTADVILTAG